MKLLQASNVLFLAGMANACLLPEERAGGSINRALNRRQGNSGKAVGKADRFNAGSAFPRGIGSGNATDMSTILNVNEVTTGLQGLVKEYGIQTFATPYKTYEGRTIQGAKIGGSGTSDTKYHVYLNGAIHARERGSHDSVLYFISDLLYAQKHGTGLTYGRKSYTNADVIKALGTGIVVTPLINPDGVNYDQTTNSCWRKNRNPKSSSGASSIGIDLNRNFDFAWGPEHWASSVATEVSSSSPSSEVFRGTAAFSEPETQSMKYILDTYTKVRWFIDLHSYAGDVLYSWGSDTDQSTQPYKNFLNATYNSIRGITGDSTTSKYGEYISSADLNDVKTAGTRFGAAMSTSTGRQYTVMQSAYLYPTSGASDDYAFSRHIADPTKNKVYSYTVEFGFGNSQASCPFYPTDAQYTSNLQETNAGFMEFLLAAADIGLE
ncbi:putative zinc carboxypeptidase [Rosellinia necatrix]|uniref:Putative zinc carboxypeptidase n=1 Tax=Rosellinia necatrix TaxID=77044 RepID=A0A1W2TJ51_ROSNE|nr:putative zinc carboxypeptidase [Rosellinia necatrix]